MAKNKEKNPKTAKSGKGRIAVYALIIGGLALASVSLFTVAQFERAKYSASGEVLATAKSFLSQKLEKDPNALTDENSKYHAIATYYNQVITDFEVIRGTNFALYSASAIPAYLASMGTLLSVGLILMHADKVKEKEEKEV